MRRYRLLEHTADIKAEIFGRDRAELFVNAAFCLFDLMVDLAQVEERERVPVQLQSSDEVELVLDWLRELCFLFSSRGLVVARVEPLELGSASLRAILHGERYQPERHGLKVELKNPTYHDFLLEQTATGWRAVVLFDA